MIKALSFFFFLVIISCNAQTEKQAEDHNDSHHNNGGWVITENEMLHKNRTHKSERMQFKLVNSKFQNEEYVFDEVLKDIKRLSDARYKTLESLILEQDIATLQGHVSKGIISYEELTLFYLKRMFIYETNPTTSLHSIISINPNVVAQAREKDQTKNLKRNAIFGMPILLKDNIDTKDMKTTAGAYVLKDNQPQENATIVDNIIANGGLIIGKANLSEWAYYFCSGCPLGYSAIGGQTLNPYGRGQFETGGSSAGSAVATAANYAVAAVGSETSGSIISPSSQNSVVGLKPTTGALSGDGVVPISHTLDTAGPMAKSVADATILYWAMKTGNEEATMGTEPKSILPQDIRLGVFKSLLEDLEYSAAIEKLKAQGVQIIEIDPEQIPLPGFLTLLNIEMRDDLPKYLTSRASKNISEKNLRDVMATNRIDSVQRMPYGQGLFEGIMADETTQEDFIKLRENLLKNGNTYFETPMKKHKLDAIATINNYHSSYAAVGMRPCLAIPMGLQESGEPKALTLITNSNTEKRLLQLGKTIESVLQGRVAPEFK